MWGGWVRYIICFNSIMLTLCVAVSQFHLVALCIMFAPVIVPLLLFFMHIPLPVSYNKMPKHFLKIIPDTTPIYCALTCVFHAAALGAALKQLVQI